MKTKRLCWSVLLFFFLGWSCQNNPQTTDEKTTQQDIENIPKDQENRLLESNEKPPELSKEKILLEIGDASWKESSNESSFEKPIEKSIEKKEETKEEVLQETIVESSSNLTVLRVGTACGVTAKFSSLTPGAQEDGYLVAVKLIPPSYPFSIEKIRYRLLTGGSGCDNTLEHSVFWWASKTSPLDSNPAWSGNTTRAGIQPTGSDIREVIFPLSQPLTLQQGQFFYVALKVVVSNGKKLCVKTCKDSVSVDQNFWSHSSSAPYSWTTLSQIGIQSNLEIEALGR